MLTFTTLEEMRERAEALRQRRAHGQAQAEFDRAGREWEAGDLTALDRALGLLADGGPDADSRPDPDGGPDADADIRTGEEAP